MKAYALRYQPRDLEQVRSLGLIMCDIFDSEDFAARCERDIPFLVTSCAFVNDINDDGVLIMPGDWPRMTAILTAWMKLHNMIEHNDDTGIMAIEIIRA